MRTEVTYLERWPYSTNSLLPRIIGEAFWLLGVTGWSCARAWLAASSPNVTPPANAAPPLRRSLRLVRSEPISPSFEPGFLSMTRRRNHVPADESIRRLAKSGQRSCQHPGRDRSCLRHCAAAARRTLAELAGWRAASVLRCKMPFGGF